MDLLRFPTLNRNGNMLPQGRKNRQDREDPAGISCLVTAGRQTKLTLPLLARKTMIRSTPLVMVSMDASAAPVPTEFLTMFV